MSIQKRARRRFVANFAFSTIATTAISVALPHNAYAIEPAAEIDVRSISPRVPITALLEGQFRLRLQDGALARGGIVRLYDQRNSGAEAAEQSCSVTPERDGTLLITRTRCRAQVDTLLAGHDVVVEWDRHTAKVGRGALEVLPEEKLDGSVTALNPERAWYQNASSTWTDDLQRIELARVTAQASDPFQLYAKVRGKWGHYSRVPVPIRVLDEASHPFDLRKACVVPRITDHVPVDEYLVCVDMTEAAAPIMMAGLKTKEGGVHLGQLVDFRPNRFLNVHVWSRSNDSVTFETSGSAGLLPPVANAPPEGLAAAGTTTELTHMSFRVAPRRDEFAEFKFTGKVAGVTDYRSSVSFRTKREYRFALRTGVAVLYSPLDQKYTLQSSGDTNNPGKAIAGSDSKRLAGELTVGVAGYPFGTVPDASDYTPAFGLYAGLGVVAATSSGADALTSFVVGFDVAAGSQFSVTVVGGLRRTRWLADGYRVGDAAPVDATDAPTRFGVTPTFGVLLNLAPYVWSTVKGLK